MPTSVTLTLETNLAIPMRDRTILYADLYRPVGSGPFPVLLQRTPYDKTLPISMGMLDPIKASKRGYAVVIQDTRGRYTSEGDFYPFRDEMSDGYDTVEWIARESWSSGKIGMYGASYVGATQLLAAISNPPHLTAIAPNVTASNYHEGWTYQGGAFELGFNASWTLLQLLLANYSNFSAKGNFSEHQRSQLIDAINNMEASFRLFPLTKLSDLTNGIASFYSDWLSHPDYDDYWEKLSIEEHYSRMDIPALHIGGWYDIFLGGTLNNFVGMRKFSPTGQGRSAQKLIIGPWVHGSRGTSNAGAQYFGLSADAMAIDLDDIHLRWFDRWLKDEHNGIMEEPPVRIFTMGNNEWRDEQTWPLTRSHPTKYYLHSAGKANTLHGDGTLSTAAPKEESADIYLFNPANPVPTQGGSLCCNAHFMPTGAFDQRNVESREDVLVYSTSNLPGDIEVTGPITVTLWAATSTQDTDFTAKLVDVCNQGCAQNISDGIVRARYRDSRRRPTLLEPGKVYCYTIDLWATSNVFKRGHKIRVEISSSNFPRFDRNPNTGDVIAEAKQMIPAIQTILHDFQHPSHITLPIIPR